MNLYSPAFRRGGTGYAGITPTPVEAAKVKDAQPDVREGDEWVFRANDGCLSRRVVIVGTDRIGYKAPGSSQMRSCLRSTFLRWARGATLEFATNWTGR